MFIIVYLQKDPEKISVSSAFMRTTSSLETYHRTLGDSIVSRAQFLQIYFNIALWRVQNIKFIGTVH